MLYTSIHNDKIKDIKKLQLKKYRDKDNMFLVEGEHLVLEAYKNSVLETVILLDGTDYDINVDKMYVSSNVLKYLSELDNPSNMIGICKIKDSIINGNRILVLDGIQDPGNLGTIIRSAIAFNIETIVLSKDTVDIYNAKVIRASQGMLFGINIVVDDIKKVIIDLKSNGYPIYGTRVIDGVYPSEVDNSKFVLIMGNEGSGVREEVLSLCDKYVYIKMNKMCESLNVAVATSIILYELDKR